MAGWKESIRSPLFSDFATIAIPPHVLPQGEKEEEKAEAAEDDDNSRLVRPNRSMREGGDSVLDRRSNGEEDVEK